MKLRALFGKIFILKFFFFKVRFLKNNLILLILDDIGFGIGFGRNKNIFSVYVSVSAKKKNGCFGQFRFRPNWKKAFRSYPRREHIPVQILSDYFIFIATWLLSLSLWHLNHGRSIEKKVPNTAAILLWSYLSIWSHNSDNIKCCMYSHNNCVFINRKPRFIPSYLSLHNFSQQKM